MENAQKYPIYMIGNKDGPHHLESRAPGSGDLAKVEGLLNNNTSFKTGIGVHISWIGMLKSEFILRFFWSPDGKFFFEDKKIINSPITGVKGTCPEGGWHFGPYMPPEASENIKAVVINNDLDVTLEITVIGCVLANSLG